VHWYPRGFVEPVDEPEVTSELVTVDFAFYPAFSSTEQLYCWVWYVRILQDDTNELLTKVELHDLIYTV